MVLGFETEELRRVRIVRRYVYRHNLCCVSIGILFCLSCVTPTVPTVSPWNEIQADQIVLENDEKKLLESSNEFWDDLQEEGAVVKNQKLENYLNQVLAELIFSDLPAGVPKPAVHAVRRNGKDSSGYLRRNDSDYDKYACSLAK